MVVDFFEIRKPITDEMIPGIVPNRYYITNHGNVWNANRNCYKAVQMDRYGYYKTHLQLIDGRDKTITVHRLVCMAFNPHPNMHNLQVNHKNGIKTCNYPDNLEWVTAKENIAHAISTGLMGSEGESNYNAHLTNEMVRNICQLMVQGVGYTDIAIQLGLPTTRTMIGIIRQIKNKTCWTSVSQYYNLENYNPKYTVLNTIELNMVCDCFQKYGKDIPNEVVLKYINKLDHFNSLDKYHKDKITRVIDCLRRKTCYNDIWSKYNY